MLQIATYNVIKKAPSRIPVSYCSTATVHHKTYWRGLLAYSLSFAHADHGFFSLIRVKDAQPVVKRRPQPGPRSGRGAPPPRPLMMRLRSTTPNWTNGGPLQEKIHMNHATLTTQNKQNYKIPLNHTNY